jgi:hypothetical protein
MAKRLLFVSGSFAATAAGAAATNNGLLSIVGGSTTQNIDILECLVSGMAAASALGGFVLTRQTSLGVGGINALASPNSDGAMDPNTAALAAAPVTSAGYVTTQPTPSNVATDAHLNLGLNSFGGILRWNAAPFQQWQQYGNAVTIGASILYNSTSYFGATANASAHIMYEPH